VAAFRYSSQLQTWLQTWFSTRFEATFSTSSYGFAACDTLSTSFRLFCRKPGREPQQVRWLMCVLDKCNVQ